MLAWRVAPSARTKKASTTFKMAGTAPKDTVQRIYAAVAALVSAPAPSSPSSGWRKAVTPAEKRTPASRAA